MKTVIEIINAAPVNKPFKLPFCLFIASVVATIIIGAGSLFFELISGNLSGI